jgi:hypothetical protein
VVVRQSCVASRDALRGMRCRGRRGGPWQWHQRWRWPVGLCAVSRGCLLGKEKVEEEKSATCSGAKSMSAAITRSAWLRVACFCTIALKKAPLHCTALHSSKATVLKFTTGQCNPVALTRQKVNMSQTVPFPWPSLLKATVDIDLCSSLTRCACVRRQSRTHRWPTRAAPGRRRAPAAVQWPLHLWEWVSQRKCQRLVLRRPLLRTLLVACARRIQFHYLWALLQSQQRRCSRCPCAATPSAS